MIKDEAFKLAMQACKETWNEKTCAEIVKALEQEPILDKIREEINGLIKYYPYPVVSPYQTNNHAMLMEDEVLQIIDKYMAESED